MFMIKKYGASEALSFNLQTIVLILPIYAVFNVLDLGISIGGSIQFAKLLGGGNEKAARRNFNQMLYASLLISIIVAILGIIILTVLPDIHKVLVIKKDDYATTIFCAKVLFISAPLFFINFFLYYYVKCDNNQKLASAGFIIGNSIDIVLTVFFINYYITDNKDAVLYTIYATLIGKTMSIFIYSFHLVSKKSIIRLNLVTPNIKEIMYNFKTGLSSSLQYLFQFIILTIVSYLILNDENSRVIFCVIIYISYIILAIYDGIGNTIQPLTGTFFGEKNKHAEKITLSLGLKWGLSIGIIYATIIIFCSELIFNIIFGDKLLKGNEFIQLYCISTIIGGYSIIMSYYYQSIGREKLAFFICIMRTLVVFLVFSFIFKFFDDKLFWWTFPLTEILSFIIWQLKKTYDEHRSTIVSDKTWDNNKIFSKTVRKNEEFYVLTNETEKFFNKWSASNSQQYYMNLVVEEICQAIFLNGFSSMNDGYIQITIIANEDSTFELHIRDNAKKFNPFDMNTKKIINDKGDGIESIGLLLVKNKVKEFFYRRYQSFNTLTVKV